MRALSPSIALLRTQSDDRLVVLARQGSEAAFAAIVERYRRPLLGACRRILPEARAEDAVQQAFVAAWRGLQRGDRVRELRPWLYRIARNTALNALRAPGFDAAELRESLQSGPAPQEVLERREAIRRTLAGLAALPERQREALLRSAVDGTPHADIARDLGLSEGATRQLVLRARTTLRTAASAMVPLPLVEWLAAAGAQPSLSRVAEIAAGAGGAGVAATLAKAGAVVVVAGTAAAGPAVVGGGDAAPEPVRPAAAKAATPDPTPAATVEPRPPAAAVPAATRPASEDGEPAREPRRQRRRRGSNSGSGERAEEHEEDRSGPSRSSGSDDLDDRDDDDRSGPSGDRDDDDDDRSGPSGEDDDRSGPSDGDADRSGPDGDEDDEEDEDDRSGSGSDDDD